MKTNASWKEYFIISRKERTVVIGLLFFLIFYSVWLIFYQPKIETPVIEGLDEQMAKLPANSGNENAASGNSFVAETDNNTQPATLFFFNPNTLDAAGFTQLGLRDKTIHTIINYRNKGGRFRRAEDIRKIYGLKKEEADRLIPYIKINAPQQENSFKQTYADNNSASKNEKRNPQIININTATAEQWKTLPAIGDVLSNRIVKFRDKMGGFSSVDQVRKTYGLSDSAYNVILPYLIISAPQTTTTANASKKTNINTATAAELKSNPEIPAEIADAIVIYRKQHGNYSSVEDIKKIVFITEETYKKVSPFLSVQ